MRALLLLALVGCDEAFDLVEVAPVPDAPVVADGLVAHWPLDGLAGDKAAELVGGHAAFCPAAECPSAVPGRIGGALHFSGGQWLYAQDAAFETTSAFTASAWLNLDAVPTDGEYHCVVSKLYGTNAGNTWQFCVMGPVLTAWFIDRSGVEPNISGPQLGAGAWHHAAVAWDGTMISLWLDGARAVAQPIDGVAFDGSLILFGVDRDFGASYGPFPGSIDDVRIYDRALSSLELQMLATSAR